MTSPFNIGPLAPERNPPITPQYFYPNFSLIESITPIDTFTSQIVTQEINQFVVGQLIRFVIPILDGMRGLNEQTCYILEITNDTTFIAGINSQNMGTFNPDGNTQQKPFIIPVGDINSGQINSMGRINNLLYIEGSFKNISPN